MMMLRSAARCPLRRGQRSAGALPLLERAVPPLAPNHVPRLHLHRLPAPGGAWCHRAHLSSTTFATPPPHHKMAEPTNPVKPEQILADVPEKWAQAKESGELIFFESTERMVPGDFPFQIRLCPGLAKKTKAPSADKDEKDEKPAKPKASPFKPPYIPELYVGCLAGVDGEQTMSVLLNKFSVAPHHFLLCPVEEEPQALPPTPPELARAYSLVQAAHRKGGRLLAFYNGGPGAGASQTWRHVQFVEGAAPVEDWVARVNFERKDRAIVHPDLPYLHIVHPLPTCAYPPTEADLAQLADALAPVLMRSLDLCFDALRRAGLDRNHGWNLLMTATHLHLIPRSAPAFELPSGPLEVNSLGYAGMLLVKTEEEDKALQAVGDRDGLTSVLLGCGVKREFGEEALTQDATQHGGAGSALDGLL